MSAKLALAVNSGEEEGGASMAEIDPKEFIFGLNWIAPNEKWGLQGLLNIVDKSKDGLKGVPTGGVGQAC